MDAKVEKALDTALANWAAMAKSSHEEAEAAADGFEASFYAFIDAVREWVDRLKPRPQTLEQLLALPEVAEIVDRLPAPLVLNFETEAELILEHVVRDEEDKYD
ncbi:hypothetical protein ACFQI7_14705 [Paenibacillus allorhizosphaerae]|uniref:Uncharacterized protein n=1 Tax=Paenibacillus allorhizosphaerae TaxID=2849866 RepID=A0ABN7THH0_9BACL|nr:hypothetical protein [Paenibacillus allorhizosphaerae]CAG7627136.1 hypothetical protein PAECIP111802_01322 [Paenibacillus allorhizosphaerae]